MKIGLDIGGSYIRGILFYKKGVIFVIKPKRLKIKKILYRLSKELF